MIPDSSEKTALELKNKIKQQEEIIATIREFFSSNSKFIKLYRKHSQETYPEMESLLDRQEAIFQRLAEIMKNRQKQV